MLTLPIGTMCMIVREPSVRHLPEADYHDDTVRIRYAYRRAL